VRPLIPRLPDPWTENGGLVYDVVRFRGTSGQTTLKIGVYKWPERGTIHLKPTA
jgi:hypothetical protein